MKDRLTLAQETAYRAGRLTLGYFRNGVAVERKSDASPVTQADREAENLARAIILGEFRQDAILGEEEGLHGVGDDRWVIDPIDGTKSFVSGVPLYATLVSYERAGEPIVAACYFPALDEMLAAQKGGGCTLNGRPCRVSDKNFLDAAVIATGSVASLDATGRLAGVVALARQTMAIRTWGDAYGHALVASGRAEAMLDPVVNRWDISAVSLIVREAGGRFSDFAGGETLTDNAISCNAELYESILGVFRA